MGDGDDDGVDSRILHLSSVAGPSVPVSILDSRPGAPRSPTRRNIWSGGCWWLLGGFYEFAVPTTPRPEQCHQKLHPKADACSTADPPVPALVGSNLVAVCEAGFIAATWHCAQHPASTPRPIDTVTVDMRCLCRVRTRKRTQEGGKGAVLPSFLSGKLSPTRNAGTLLMGLPWTRRIAPSGVAEGARLDQVAEVAECGRELGKKWTFSSGRAFGLQEEEVPAQIS
ncbi:hypothetical protein QBC34DRAFT_430487 [Podospora aff. communis PSN243]|uniref:Uncharacterized protein n=1 Tax=Podospora aff. communis PSN243 TaxID=3040156 RepID=A0AAV9G6J6_9PEZI|nr:hypothetical protein QBC34DRAFT_430487 [Podospora aff. communis PSN243]